MPDTLGNWHDSTTLRAVWRNLPIGSLGEDLTAAAYTDCVRHLQSEGIEVPEDGSVPAAFRLAQQFFAQAEWATTATNSDDDVVGMDGYSVSVNAFRKRARDLLGYKTLGIG